MTDLVLSERHGRVALITLNKPAANALTAPMRLAAFEAITTSLQAPDVDAIVIAGAGRSFCSGVDLTEYDVALTQPWVRDLCQLIEDAPKPVVCALQGLVLGAGFELALAAHARTAKHDTKFAMADVKLGMLPGSGGTQRLPRLIGAGRALELLLSGQAILATDPRLKKVITRLSDGDPLADALTLAKEMADRGTWAMTRDAKQGLSDPVGFQNTIAAINTQISDPASVEADIIRCVEAAQLLPFDQGVTLEATLFEDRLTSSEARGPRHSLMAERLANLLPGQAKPTKVSNVTVIGADSLAAEVSVACLASTSVVSVVAATAADVKAVTKSIVQLLKASARSEPVLRDQLGRLRVSDNVGFLSEADLIFDTGAKAPAFDVRLKPTVVWAGLVPGLMASRGGPQLHPSRFVGLHMYRPAHKRPMTELATSSETDAQAVSTLLTYFQQMGRSIVRSKPPAGYLGERFAATISGAACQLVAHGASPYEVDQAAQMLGFAQGPFMSMDQEGLRQAVIRLSGHTTRHPGVEIETALIQALADKGRHGWTSARGIYVYGNGGPTHDIMVDELALELTLGDETAGFDVARLSRALHAAIAIEGANLLAERAVQRATDLDLLMVRGMGFARKKGGPLLQADLCGIFSLYREMQTLSLFSPIWKPPPQILQMVKNGDGFFGRCPAG